MNQSDSVTPSPRSELELWRSEVREFCEDALRQLQQLTNMLESELTNAEDPRAKVDTDTVTRMETSTLIAPPPPASSDDSSRSRLENLKRQLSEKLRQSNSNSQDPREA